MEKWPWYTDFEKMTLIYNQFLNDSDEILKTLRDTHTNYVEAYDWSLCIKGTPHLNINLGSKVCLDPAE